jgi:hypothetical protein
MNTVDERLNQSHENTMRFVYQQLESTDPQMVASTMLAIAMRLYKTILTPSDFERFVSVVSEESDGIEPFERPSIN